MMGDVRDLKSWEQKAEEMLRSARGSWVGLETLLTLEEPGFRKVLMGQLLLIMCSPWKMWAGNELQRGKELDLCRRLLEAGAEAGACDAKGRSAVSLAAEKGSWELVEMLARHGADINKQDVDGESALMRALEGPKEDALRMVEGLLRLGAHVSARNRNGMAPMRLVIERAQWGQEPRLIEALAAAGANVSQQDPHGWSALTAAADLGLEGACQSLIKAGARVNDLDKSGWAPIARAARGGRFARKVVQALMEAGADPGLRGEEGLNQMELVLREPDVEGSHEIALQIKTSWERKLLEEQALQGKEGRSAPRL